MVLRFLPIEEGYLFKVLFQLVTNPHSFEGEISSLEGFADFTQGHVDVTMVDHRVNDPTGDIAIRVDVIYTSSKAVNVPILPSCLFYRKNYGVINQDRVAAMSMIDFPQKLINYGEVLSSNFTKDYSRPVTVGYDYSTD